MYTKFDKALSEDEIVSNWRHTDKVYVSILCWSYNHEEYLEDALNGFMNQITDFKFEVIVHDDASTDDSQKIISEYASKYPTIIKPILQTENLYSRGVNSTQIVFDAARGEYLAICEGDDFWCSSDKLDKQVKLLQKYSDIDLCFHPTYKLFSDNNVSFDGNNNNDIVFIPRSDSIKMKPSNVPTPSMLMRKKAVSPYPEYLLNKAPVGDMFWQILSSYSNGSICINQGMSVYRVLREGSWTAEHRNNDNKEKILGFIEALHYCLEKLKTENGVISECEFAVLLSREYYLAYLRALKVQDKQLCKNLITKSLSYNKTKDNKFFFFLNTLKLDCLLMSLKINFGIKLKA